MFRRVLVPLDGSADAETVLDHLPPFLAPEGEVILLHVLPEPHPSTGATPVPWLALQRGADDYLANVSRHGIEAPIKTFVDVGEAGERILKVASAVKSDLVALTPYAWRGAPRAGLGEIARRVLRGAEQAVLFVRPWLPSVERGPRKFLIPLEGPAWSRTETDPILPIAARQGAEVVLLHVETPEPDPLEGSRTDPPLAIAAHDRLRRYQEGADYLRSFGVDARVLVGRGDPAREILDHAKTLGTQLIAMTTHGRSGLERLVAGSVTERVIRSADCPVLAMRTAGVPSRVLPNGSKV